MWCGLLFCCYSGVVGSTIAAVFASSAFNKKGSFNAWLWCCEGRGDLLLAGSVSLHCVKLLPKPTASHHLPLVGPFILFDILDDLRCFSTVHISFLFLLLPDFKAESP